MDAMMRPVLLLALLALAACAGTAGPGTAPAPLPNAGAAAPLGVDSPELGTIAVPGPGPSGVQGGQPTTGVEMQSPPEEAD